MTRESTTALLTERSYERIEKSERSWWHEDATGESWPCMASEESQELRERDGATGIEFRQCHGESRYCRNNRCIMRLM